MNDKEWIDSIRQKEREFEESAPEGLWDDIEQELTTMLSRRKFRIMPLWVRLGGVAAAVAVLCVLGVRLFVVDDRLQSDLSTECNTVKKSVGGGDNRDNYAHVKSGVDNNSTLNIANPMRHVNHAYSECRDTVIESVTATEKNVQVDDMENPMPIEIENKKETLLVENPDEVRIDDYSESSCTLINTPHEKGKSISFMAYAGNMMMTTNTTQSGYNPVSGSFIRHDGYLSNIPVGDSPATDILLSNQGEDVRTKTSHRLPIRLGVNVSIPVWNKLSIETGLTYSILSSTSESGANSNMFETKQTLHYIGIPIKASYEIWNKGNFDLYTTAGGMIEKCIYGRSVTDFVIGNSVVSSESEKVNERKFQFSILAGIGVKWNITKSINVFLEPGISYYIDNHSDVINTYKDKPFNFDLKIGLCFGGFLKSK